MPRFTKEKAIININGEDYYSTNAAKEKLKITRHTIRSYIKQKKLKAKWIYGLWYIPESEINRILQGEPRNR